MKKNISTSVRNLLSFCFVLLFTIAYAQTTVTEIFQYTGLVQNFTVPQGVTSIKIEAWGGGGAGGGAVNDGEFLTGVKLGSGGGGSAFAGNNSLAVTAGAIYNVFVGKGGVGTANGNMGENGGDSYFRLSTNSANIVMAKGGYGGSGSASGGPNQSQGGQANASDGAIKNSGGNGTSRSGVTSGSGGAAPNGGGTGGAGIGDWFEVASGNIGGFPGGGGGGAKVGWLNNSKQAGGNGGNGQVKITYTITLPAISITPASATICSGAKVNLKASPATSSGIYTYEWTIPETSTFVGVGESIEVSPTTTTTYRVTGKFSRGGQNITKTKDVTITVNPNVNAGSITASSSSLCIGGTSNLNTTGTAGGAWSSSSNSIATVNSSGVVTGVNPGTATITYTVTGCGGTKTATTSITVNPNVNAGSITASSSSLCIGGTSNLSTTGTAGGAWSSSSNSIATVNSSGVVTGVNPGTATITYTVSGCGGTKTATTSITVNPNVNAGTISANLSSICVGGTSNLTTTGTTGGTWSSSTPSIATVSSSGVVTGVSPGTATITYTVTGCGSQPKTSSIIMTVNPLLPVSVAISANPGVAICAPGTNITFTAIPTNGGASPSYQWKVNGGNVGTNSATFSSSTLANNDTVTVTITSDASLCTSGSPATSNTLIIGVASTSTYSASGWDNGIPSATNQRIAKISADYSTSAAGNDSFTACSCEVDAGKTLKITADKFVELQGGLTNNGSVIVEPDGNLKQLSSQKGINTGSGTTIVQQKLDLSALGDQYNYLATPVEFAPGQSFKTIYPGVTGTSQPQVLYYVERTRYFYQSSGANILGRSSAVKEVTKALVPSGVVEFKGVPFVGDIVNYPLDYSPTGLGFNLVGNPYPTNIDLDVLYTLNKDNIKAEFRFWDNKANNIYEQQGANYSGSAYAIYNAKSITGVLRTSTASALAAPRTPNKILKVGQGFMVQALGSGKSLLWSNPATLKTTDNTGSLFFGKTALLNRYWLRFKTPNDLVLSSAIVYISSLSNAKGMEDSDVDSNESNSFYTFTTDGSGVVINGRSSFTTADQVPIGVTHYQDGKYEISLGDQEGVFANAQAIYLKDNDLKTITDLSKGNYSYFGEKGSFTNRFEIVYTQSNFDGVLNNKENSIGGVKVYLERDDFVVDAKDKDINQVSIYDMQGRLLKTIMDEKRVIRISKSSLGKGIFLLRIVQGSTITTKKIKN